MVEFFDVLKKGRKSRDTVPLNLTKNNTQSFNPFAAPLAARISIKSTDISIFSQRLQRSRDLFLPCRQQLQRRLIARLLPPLPLHVAELVTRVEHLCRLPHLSILNTMSGVIVE